MKIHEYQARELLRAAGITVPPGRVIDSIEDAGAAFKEATAGMASPLAVVKAQVHAGGRGKAGFVKLVRSAEEALAFSFDINPSRLYALAGQRLPMAAHGWYKRKHLGFWAPHVKATGAVLP